MPRVRDLAPSRFQPVRRISWVRPTLSCAPGCALTLIKVGALADRVIPLLYNDESGFPSANNRSTSSNNCAIPVSSPGTPPNGVAIWKDWEK